MPLTGFNVLILHPGGHERDELEALARELGAVLVDDALQAHILVAAHVNTPEYLVRHPQDPHAPHLLSQVRLTSSLPPSSSSSQSLPLIKNNNRVLEIIYNMK